MNKIKNPIISNIIFICIIVIIIYSIINIITFFNNSNPLYALKQMYKDDKNFHCSASAKCIKESIDTINGQDFKILQEYKYIDNIYESEAYYLIEIKNETIYYKAIINFNTKDFDYIYSEGEKKYFGTYNRSNTDILFDETERNALIYSEYTTKIIEADISKAIKKDYKLF